MKDHIFKTILLLFLMVLVPFFFVTPAQAAPGDYLFQWGPQHSLYAPMGVAVDGSGNVLVVDCFNQRIQKFDSSGAHTMQWGNSGTGDGQFRIPCGIASNGIGTIMHVADTENNRIQAFVGYGANTYTLTYTSLANGTINGVTPQIVKPGGSGTQVTAVANPGYRFVSWSDGVTTAARTDTNVTSNISVTATFSRIFIFKRSIAINFVAGPHGSITGTTAQIVNYGGSTNSVTAVPDTGYHFVSWTYRRKIVSTSATLILTNVTTSQVITANFAPNHYTITFVTDGYGSITGTTSQTGDFSESTSSVTAVPSNGYRFVSWTGTNGFVSTDNPLVITGVTTNLKVKANLAR